MRATRFHYVNSRGTQSIVSSAALVQQAQADQADALHAVCVVENISPEYIKDLVAGLRLYPTFFLEHAIHTPKDQFWELHHSWDPATTLSDSSVPFNSAHIDGMFEYHELEYSHKSDLTSAPNFVQRDCFIQEPFPIQSNTRISYYRVSPWLYLILVDAPLDLRKCARPDNSRARTSLRLRYSTNRGGLLLPQLFSQQEYSLFAMFKSFLDHDWHLDPLFNRQSGVLPPHPFLYILSSSLWETNFRWLDAKIKRISFRDLRDPKDTTNDDLHDCREDLVYIQHHIAECINWTDPSLVTFLEEMEPRNKYELGTIRNPISNLRRVLDDSEKLQAFLSDTFQLLMSSISVRDSRISAEEAVKSSRQAILNAYQARQSAWLTQLATMYLPLSVLTGIFGMNIKELNDAHASFWWPIVVLVILMGCTGIAYSILKLKDGWRPTGLRFRKQKGSLPNITP